MIKYVYIYDDILNMLHYSATLTTWKVSKKDWIRLPRSCRDWIWNRDTCCAYAVGATAGF